MIALTMVIHYIADFLLQSREMGKKKSQEPLWLLAHLLIQINCFCWGLWYFVGATAALKFALANALIHGIIDWNVWRGYKLYAYYRIRKDVARKFGTWTQPPEEDVNIKAGIAAWKYWEDHGFYSTIGFDQLLHGLTLVFLVKALHL